jgi:hypothetical protein
MNVLKLLKKENEKLSLQLTMDDYVLIRDIMKKMNIFKINSYDALIIQRDLIGMAHEMKIRETSLTQEMGDGFDDFIKEVVQNSRGPSYWEIGLSLLKKLTFMIAAWIVFFSWLQGWPSEVALPAFILILIPLQFLNEAILLPIFILEKGFKKQVPFIITIAIYLPLILLLGQDIRGVVEVPTMPTLIVSLTVYALAYWGYRKHMSDLAKDEQTLVEDLIR